MVEYKFFLRTDPRWAPGRACMYFSVAQPLGGLYGETARKEYLFQAGIKGWEFMSRRKEKGFDIKRALKNILNRPT